MNALDIRRMNVIPGSKKKKRDQSNFVEKRGEETLLMSFHVMKVADQCGWVVDSGCNNHMIGCKKFFSTLNENVVLLFVLATMQPSK